MNRRTTFDDSLVVRDPIHALMMICERSEPLTIYAALDLSDLDDGEPEGEEA